ncbi:GTPase-activating Rap/Ran-GAP domain-like protein 3 isoform X3 [Tubulanus polymorphus]|uniref:GTPase-activating Rap/Ran-GAP domain-like protein 3 isoform X3 n=1 Tax=Tubulanus polymorphus TaxID=672921 RepID=UPI003DA36AD8
MEKIREKLNMPKAKTFHETGSLESMVKESMFLGVLPMAGYGSEGDGSRSPSPRSPRSPRTPRSPRFFRKMSAVPVVDETDDSDAYHLCPGTITKSSSASDLAARRGVFSRRHYGSVELLTSCDGDGTNHNAGRFRVETGERDGEEVTSPLGSPVHLENPEFHTRWYFKYFLGRMHQNYVGMDAEKEPFIVSVVLTDANNHSVLQYRAILWRKPGAQKLCLPYNPNKPMTVKGILGHFNMHKLEKGPKEIFNPEIQKELLVLEEQEGSVNFKFGVLYAKEGQRADDEMYGNENGNAAFEKLINLLGEKINLKGWEKFRAGLDVKGNTTGETSVYTVYEGHEIMFHVSTMLPYSKENKQQVERKRHVGNDIVNIVFLVCGEDQTPTWRPSMMKTHFTHIYALVTHDPESDSFRLNVYSEESVPLFGPPLPSPPVFYNHQEFRDFLLVKLINGEKAAFNTPVFAQKRERTLDMLIKNLYQEYMPEISKNNMINRRAFSDVIPDIQHGSRRKEEARHLEFVRIGQALKLKTILKGDAPTSMITTGLLKREPWEPHCFHHDFQHEIICGDSWGDKLIIATTAGTFVLEEDLAPRMIFDRTVVIKQLNVIEAHGLLIFRADKGKDCKVHVFRLTDFEGEMYEDCVRSKPDCKEHKIEKTRGCQSYAVSRPSGSHLRLAVALGKRILLYAWKHSVAWSAWCQPTDNETAEGFQFIRELSALEPPQLLTLIDGPRGDNQICVGYKHQFDLINEKNGDTIQLHHVDSAKINLVSAIDIYEDDEPELLLCYNHVSHFQKLNDQSSEEFDFLWNSAPQPQGIVCAFPYIMAFTPDTIEIRLIINGNLVNTMTMPKLFLITSKCDIYFASSAHNTRSYSPTETCKCNMYSERRDTNSSSFSPPPSPSVFIPTATTDQPLNIYKIPLTCLAGQSAEKAAVQTSSSGQVAQPQSLLAPLVNTTSTDTPTTPTTGRRSPLMRVKGVTISPNISLEDYNDRHDSCSSDSGIHMHKLSSDSPPSSPFTSVNSVDLEETDII